MRRGFSAVEAVIILGVVILLAGVGYVGWKALMQSESGAQESAMPSQTVEVITTKADLEEAEKALSELNFEDSDSAAAETQATL